MILIGRNMSPFVRRVAVVLELLERPYEQRALSSIHDQEALREINPVGRVPALVLGEDEGEVLIDSAAILDHLIEEAGGRGEVLLPSSGPQRRRILQAVALMNGALEKVVAAHYERTRRPEDKVHQPWVDFLRAQAASALAALEVWVPSPWLVGEDMTLADVVAATGLGFLHQLGEPYYDPSRYPALEALAARCEALPAFQRAPIP